MMIYLVVTNLKGRNSGNGGHYYSVQSQMRFLNNMNYTVRLVVLGESIPKPFENHQEHLIHLNSSFSIMDVISGFKLISELPVQETDVIHCFDMLSLIAMKLHFQDKRVNVLFTKCGGKSLKKIYRFAVPDIVYHQQDLENYDKYIECKSRENDLLKKPTLFPNRVLYDARSSELNLAENIYSDVDAVKILRIARICQKYKGSIESAMSLHRSLIESGLKSELLIIGYPEDSRALASIMDQSRRIPNIKIITCSRYTKNASRFIKYADIVVASGRGAMEAAVEGKIVLFQTDTREKLQLLDSSSINDGLFYNFSERYPGEKVKHVNLLLDKLINLLADKDDYDKRIKEISNQYFVLNTDKSRKRYKQIYDTCSHQHSSFSQYLSMRIFLLRLAVMKYLKKNG